MKRQRAIVKNMLQISPKILRTNEWFKIEKAKSNGKKNVPDLSEKPENQRVDKNEIGKE